MKHKGQPFYCPNSGICVCQAFGGKIPKPKPECIALAKRKSKK